MMRTGQRTPENTSEHRRVIERVMRTHLLNTPVLGQRSKTESLHTQVQPSSQLNGAQRGSHRQLHSGTPRFSLHKPVVKARVVSNEDPARQHAEQIVGDLSKTRLTSKPRSGKPVNVGRARIHPRVKQAMPSLFDVTGSSHRDRGDAEYARAGRIQARRFDVDDHKAGMRVHDLSVAASTDKLML